MGRLEGYGAMPFSVMLKSVKAVVMPLFARAFFLGAAALFVSTAATAQEFRAQGVPAQEAPAQEFPAQEVPAQEFPKDITGAIPAQRSVFIDVVGAPGDGEKALKTALSKQFAKRGFAVMKSPTAHAYEIQGMVRMAPAGRGEERVRIDWTIFGPEGVRLENVTQTNVIPRGSLNRRWGAAADAAAADAAHNIMRQIQP